MSIGASTFQPYTISDGTRAELEFKVGGAGVRRRSMSHTYLRRLCGTTHQLYQNGM